MKQIKNVTIGISTYGELPRSHFLINSINTHINDKPSDVNLDIVLCDDGTNPSSLAERRAFCKTKGVQLIEHGINRGIPQVWNTIIQESPQADAIIIFSDGIRLISVGWLSRMIHFLENNEQVGAVGIPTVGEPSEFKQDDPRWDGTPGRVGAAVGCSFAFRPEVGMLVENVDGSRGFWTSLKSFHEEISWGFELSKLGYLNYMLPWSPAWYRGGMAFAAHGQEIGWMDENSYLPKDEFIYWAQLSRWYVPNYLELYQNGRFDRMSYSRIMFCKKWGILDECQAGRRYQAIKGEEVDILSEPQKFVHPIVVDKWPAREIKWLDRNGEEKTFIDA